VTITKLLHQLATLTEAAQVVLRLWSTNPRWKPYWIS